MSTPGGKPTLTIPIAMDAAKALEVLAQLDKAMDKAGASGDDAGKKTSRSLSEADKQAEALLGRFTAMMTAGAALGAVKSAIDTIGNGLKAAADETARMAKEFNDYRRMALELAGVQGKGASNDFTLDQVKLAQEAGISPQQMAAAQQAMTEQIAGNIGEGKTLTQEQANNITKKTAAFGVARGIDPQAIATLVGGLTRASKGGPDADKDILDKFGKLINLMDASPGKVERLLPELNEVMAGGTLPEEAGALISVMAGRGRPGESGTYGRAATRAISGILGRGGETFGIDVEDSTTSAARKIFDQAAAEKADFANPIAMGRWFSGKGIKADEEQQALSALFNLGFRNGGLENAQGTIAKGSAAAIDESVERFRASDEGKQQAEEAGLAAARLKQGAKMSPFLLAQTEAERQLTEEGRFTQYGASDFAFEYTPGLESLFGDRRSQLINRRTVTNLQAKAREAGVTSDQVPSIGVDAAPPLIGPSAAQDYASQLLKAIEENTRKAPPAVSAPPPEPNTRP